MPELNINDIRQDLINHFGTDDIHITDDHHLHLHHGSFQHDKAYLTITIPKQPSLSRIALHRTIMQRVHNICQIPIHAIAIRCT